MNSCLCSVVIPVHPIHWDFMCRFCSCSPLGFRFVQPSRRHPFIRAADSPLFLLFCFYAVLSLVVRNLFYPLVVSVV